MKKITLYLHILTLLLITACSNEDIIVPTPSSGEEGQECTLTFTVKVPELSTASRALNGDAANIKTMKLLVFDANEKNYLYERTATLNTKTSTGGTYSVSLVTSSEPRIIHFVATHASSLEVPYQVSEFGVVSQLYSSDDDAYWQKVEVKSIMKETVTENGQEKEQVTAEGITNKPVTLVRNVARITLTSTTEDFVIAGFAIVNAPSKGSIAPYYMTPNADGENFPNYVVENKTANGVTSALGSYTTLTTGGYIGVPYPSGTTLSTVPDDDNTPFPNQTLDQESQIFVQYMYERTQEKDNAFLVVKRDLGATATPRYKYYKIDILKAGTNTEEDRYYRILRNFSYDITIKGVDGTATGSDTPEDAAEQDAAANNLAISENLQDLSNIAYENERLFVSKTEVVWTKNKPGEDGTNYLSFKFKYYDTTGTLNNDAVSFIFDDEYRGAGIVTNAQSKSDCVIPEGLDDDDFATIMIPVTDFVDRPDWKEQYVTVKGTGILSRKVNMILIEPYESQVGCSLNAQEKSIPPTPPDDIPLTVGSSVYVYFSMPAGLPESIFPLTFILSPEAHSITPTSGDMPLVSLLNHEDATMQGLKYGFEKVIKWEDYDAKNEMIVKCPFKTSLAESASNIYVYNEYFDLESTSFTNPEHTTIIIPAKNITVNGQNLANTYSQTWTIYTDSNYTNSIGTCSFIQVVEQSGWWSNTTYYLPYLTLYIPEGVDNLYFVYQNGNITYQGTMPVTELREAQNTTGKVLNIR